MGTQRAVRQLVDDAYAAGDPNAKRIAEALRLLVEASEKNPGISPDVRAAEGLIAAALDDMTTPTA